MYDTYFTDEEAFVMANTIVRLPSTDESNKFRVTWLRAWATGISFNASIPNGFHACIFVMDDYRGRHT